MDETTLINMETSVNASEATISLAGRLDIDTTPRVWQQCLDFATKQGATLLTLNVSDVTYCDNAGFALFQALEKLQTTNQHAFHLTGLAEQFERLMQAMRKSETGYPAIQKKSNRHQFALLKDLLNNLHDDLSFLGLLVYQFLDLFKRNKGVRWRDFGFALNDVGPRALPIVVLCGFLIGLISTFQSAEPLGRFGGQVYLINLVGLGLTREMGPLITAILLAGRTASSFAAELGTMKLNQELDALTTMGISPVKCLAIPRILATAIMTPLLNVFLILSGLIGCAVVMSSLGYNMHIFINQLEESVRLQDFIGGSIKGFVFGLVIAGIGCMHGLKTKIGSSAIGRATTQAVVSSLIMIIFVDGIFAYIYYILKV